METVLSEENEQMIFFTWIRMQSHHTYPHLARLAYSTLNGARMSIGVRVKAKKTGMRKGVLDICIPVPLNGFHGLYIEMKKSKGGRCSEEQIDEIMILSQLGYKCVICAGAGEAIKAVKKYYGVEHD